jgi:3-hydroxyacyl-CoA dehydrogenase
MSSLTTRTLDGLLCCQISATAPQPALLHQLAELIRQAAASPPEALLLFDQNLLFTLSPELACQPQWLEALDALLAALDQAAMPVIALPQRHLLDVGLELALACRHRIVTPAARIGMGALQQGLMPGHGGSQRLTRRIGAELALDLLLGGKPLNAEGAKACGLIDAIDATGGEASAVALVRQLLAAGSGSVAAAQPNPQELATIFERASAQVARSRRGQFAPQAILQAVRAAVEDSAQGFARERALYLQCRDHPQRAALAHLSRAERFVTHVPDVPADTSLMPMHRAAVIGSGTMGGGIAMNFANADIPVTLLDVNQEMLDRGLGVIRRNYEIAVQRGSLTQGELERRMALIGGTTDYAAIAEVDIVIEAVFEDMALKQQVFAQLDQAVKPGALLATNTSGLDIDQIASATRRPANVIGLHFFSPANVMRLLEIVRGAATSASAIASSMALAQRMRKVGVLAGNCPGFIGNRMIHGYIFQANQVALEGASYAQVDRVIREFGLPMGPFTMMDLTGLDVGWRARKASGRPTKPTERVHDRLCELERFGQKRSAGFYLYQPGGRVPTYDPLVDQLLADAARECGIARREFSDEEVLDRCIFPLINEGAKILQEGMALRPGDIDVVYVNGYGFPAYRGGPMHHADQLGLDRVYRQICQFEATLGEFWQPAELLRELASAGNGFGSLDP